MKVLELLKISTNVLEVMSRNGVFRDDFMYIEAYEQFLNMRRNKVKHIVAIMELSDELGVSPRTLERAFKRLGSECKPFV